MPESYRGPSDEDENVSARLPKTEIEAAQLRPVIAELLLTIPETWAVFDLDTLTALQDRALFLLAAAGMVERRGWLRATIANHPTCFELRYQATGEGGFDKALEHATAIEFQTWRDVWREWRVGETRDRSPFHVVTMTPQEWRLTDQGIIARAELRRARSNADLATVLDFVIKRGEYGPGYWVRLAAQRPLTSDQKHMIEKELAAGRELDALSRPFVSGSGQLLEIRKVQQAPAPQAVNLTNWGEGAAAFAEAFGKWLGPTLEGKNQSSSPAKKKSGEDTGQVEDRGAPTEVAPSEPILFIGGAIVFHSDRVELCGVDICSGPRSKNKRTVLEVLTTKRSDGKFEAYSQEELSEKTGLKSVAGLIRDLRDDVVRSLLARANISCGRLDVILSGDSGYRFAECLTVQFVDQRVTTDIRDIADTEDRADVPNSDVPNVPNSDVPDVRDDEAVRRGEWILEQLGNGIELKVMNVASHFKRSKKTAQRDLNFLREEGKIEYVGDNRNGFYRLRRPKASRPSRRKP